MILAFFCKSGMVIAPQLHIVAIILPSVRLRLSYGGFTISTFLFLLFSLPLLGRRNPVEIMGVAALTTGALLYAFGYFFQIMLP